MKYSTTLALVSTIAVITATPSFGQERGEKAREGQGHQLMAERSTPTFVKAILGPNATINDEAGYTLGSMIDHVIDRETGKLLFVAVQLREEVGPPRLVPFERFNWNPETETLFLPITREFLTSLPTYDAELLQRTGELGARTAGANENSSAAREAGMARKLPRRLAATSLTGTKVLAMNERVGSVSELLIDPQHGMVAFVLVHGTTTGNDPYIMPWQALAWRVTEKQEGYFMAPVAAHQLATAPTLKAGDPALLREKEVLHGIRAFFKNVEPEARVKPEEQARG